MRPQLKGPGLHQGYGKPHPLRPGEIPLGDVEVALLAPVRPPGVPAPDAPRPIPDTVPSSPDHVPAQALLQNGAVQELRLREHRVCRRNSFNPGKDLEPQLHDLPGIQGTPDLIEAVQEPVVPDGELPGIGEQPFRRALKPLHSLDHFFLVRIFGPDQPAVLLGGFQQVTFNGPLALVVGVPPVPVEPPESDLPAQNILQRSGKGMCRAVVDLPLVMDRRFHLRQISVRNCRSRDPEDVVPRVAFARNEAEAVLKFAHGIIPPRQPAFAGSILPAPTVCF